jgi:aspartate/methionine/tyrosine aminotransferase
VIDAAARAMNEGKTGYCPNYGIPELREALAEDVGRARGIDYGAENVAIQPGGKPTIGKLLLALVNPGDEVLYPTPGFPIYESQIEFQGARPVPYRFVEGERNFRLNLEAIESSLTPRTRLFIYNDLQNPTGAESSDAERAALAELAVKHDFIVLSDEAYFDIHYSGRSQSIASLPGMRERTVILYTFSKKYAMTGWRLGATIGPKAIVDTIAKLNVNDESCTNHFVQWAGVEAIQGDQSGARAIVETLRERRDRAHALLTAIEGVRCFRPEAAFYLFPNVTEAMKRKGMTGYEDFRRAALHATGVAFCTRAHFGRPLADEEEKYLRFAYSGIDVKEIEEGLGRLKEFMEGA